MVEIISNNIVVLCDILLWVIFHYIFDKLFERKMKEYKKKIEVINLTEN